jgi:hypothetical protein
LEAAEILRGRIQRWIAINGPPQLRVTGKRLDFDSALDDISVLKFK